MKIVKLESIVDILDNLRQPINSTERSSRIGKIPYYGATGEVGTIDKAIFNENLLLLGEDGVPFFDRNKHKAYEISGPSWVNNHAHVLRAKPSLVIQKYLLYFLNNFNYSGYVNGATRLKLTQGDMKRIPVPLPSLVKQKIIVEKLDNAFAEIDSLEKGIEQIQINIEKIESTLLLNLWEKHRKALTLKKLSDVADYENGKAHENLIDENGDFKLVNSKFISTGGLKFKRTTLALSPLTKGEIAMVLSDVPNGKALAKCFLVDKDDVYSLNQRICKISSRELIPEYLFINLNRNPYLLGFNNGENQTNLRLKDVLNTPVYLTDILNQELIVKEYKEQFTYINIYKTNLGEKLNLLRDLKQSFLGNEFSPSGLAAQCH